jgi:hypothetical protein
MITLLRGAPDSRRLDLVRKVAASYDWSVTVAYPATAENRKHRAMICGTGTKRAWIPGMVLDAQALYDEALIHHGWGADCVLCVDDDERRQDILVSRGIDCRGIALSPDPRLLRSPRRSYNDALREVCRWLGVGNKDTTIIGGGTTQSLMQQSSPRISCGL